MSSSNPLPAWIVHELMHGAGKEHRDTEGKRDGALPEDKGTIFYPNDPSDVVKNKTKGNAGLTKELRKVFNTNGKPKDNRKENNTRNQSKRKVR